MHRAFTLIELLAVLAIVALLTSGVTLSLKGTLRDAQAEDAAGRLVAFDALVREDARRFNRPSELRIELRAGRLWRTGTSQLSGNAADGTALELPAGVVIEEVVTARGRSRIGDDVAIACSVHGQTASYAILLRGPGDRRRWVMFAGMTGQSDVIENDRDVHDIFAVLSDG